MNAIKIVRALGPVDLKNVRRDSLLMWLPGIPLAMALLLRIGVPEATRLLADNLAFDLESCYILLMSSFALLMPPTIGMVIGFLLLDERDERVFTALLVTPMPLSGYLLYRLTLPMLIGIGMTMIAYPIAGLVPLGWVDLLAVATVGSLTAPMVALILATFAENKVAGFAAVKMLNAVLLLPVAAYFLPGAWQLLAGILPPFWPLKVFWLAAEGEGYWPYWVAGLAVNAAALLLLLRRFDTVMHR